MGATLAATGFSGAGHRRQAYRFGDRRSPTHGLDCGRMRGSPSSSPTPAREAHPLPEPGLGIAILNEREGLGDGFSKLHLLRALKRAYPAEKITWVVSESDSPYRLVMAEIARPYVDRVIID